MSKQTFVISLGGSIIAPKEINTKFLNAFKKLILDFVKKGNRVIIITGGGNTSRMYQNALKKVNTKISHEDLDWIGIDATILNAKLIRDMFGAMAEKNLLGNPAKKIVTNKRIIVGSGYVPGSSSDKDAVLAAKTYGVKTVINLSNIAYVYNKDPKKFKDAKPLKEISWSEFRKIIGNRWIPGGNFPFGPPAAILGHKYKLKLIVMKGSDLESVDRLLKGKSFKGTTIH